MLLILRTLRQLVPLLPDRAQRFIAWYIVATSLLAAVDVVAIALLAISLGSMVTGSDIVLPVFGSIGPESYVWFLLVISLIVIVKAALSLTLQWFATRRFASFELERRFSTEAVSQVKHQIGAAAASDTVTADKQATARAQGLWLLWRAGKLDGDLIQARSACHH